MRRKIFKSGNSTVVSLPPEIVEHLGVSLGDEVEIEFGENEHEVLIAPLKASMTIEGVDEDFTARYLNLSINTAPPSKHWRVNEIPFC
jgi:putative addiction module antidote